jgi:L-histidine N-alpha-methyltransferase
VTAEFNRNVLNVVNTNLDADLDPDRFEHRAVYDDRRQWIEMRLYARDSHEARIEALALDVPFDEGEHIQTEISCKFTEERLEREYARAGLELLDVYTDRERLFALSLAGPNGA